VFSVIVNYAAVAATDVRRVSDPPEAPLLISFSGYAAASGLAKRIRRVALILFLRLFQGWPPGISFPGCYPWLLNSALSGLEHYFSDALLAGSYPFLNSKNG